MRFSTPDLPERDRVPFWREVFGRQVAHVEVEPESEDAFAASATLFALPDVKIAWFGMSAGCLRRTTELLKDGDDDFALLISLEGGMVRSQRDRELEANAGDAVAILHCDPATMRFRELKQLAVLLPRKALSPLVNNLEEASTQLVPRQTEALALLRSYLAALFEVRGVADPTMSKLVATHIRDLIAIAIGATRDGAEIAYSGGVRAARLRAIKADILAHLRSPELSEIAVALRQGVTPRYVRMLFETEGTSFSGFVLEQRLLLAYRILANPLHDASKISSIAFAAGFGDLSYFNRCFRRRFGATPTQYRGGNGRVDKTE